MRELAGLFAVEVCGYFTLLDWTGREHRANKRGAIPDHLAPIMGRLGLNRSNWGGNRARLRSTVQAGGGAIELARRCRGAPLTALVPGQGGGSNCLCVGYWLDAKL
jgi:hypothetical protein